MEKYVVTTIDHPSKRSYNLIVYDRDVRAWRTCQPFLGLPTHKINFKQSLSMQKDLYGCFHG